MAEPRKVYSPMPDWSRYYSEDFHDTSERAYSLKTDDVEGAGCFVAGTKIFTQLGWKPIEKVKPGAMVITFDKDGNLEHGYVRQVHKHKKEQQKDGLIKFTLSDETVLTVTANHGMWQDNEETPFVEARTLRLGDSLYDMQGEALEIVGRKTESLAKQDDDFCSYNLTVFPQHTYIAEGVRVHNGGGDKGGQQRTPVESPNTLRSKTTAKIQEIISEGEIEGLVNDGQSLYFDNTPILNADDSPNFEDVAFIFHEGTPDQGPMPGFDATEAEAVVNVEMQAGSPGVVRAISGGTDAVRVTIQLPGGLYFTDTMTGDIKGHTVDIEIETRLTGGVWESQMEQTIQGKTMSTYEASFRLDAPQPYDGVATWEVRASRNSAVDAKVTTKSVTFFARVTEIQEIAIAYENTCVSGVTVDSKATGGNIPVRSYDVKGIKMQIPTNYDPITRIYTGSWDGSFKVEWTDNPAWVVYDLLTSTRYGLGDYIDATTIDKFSFYDAAVYNDELVDDGDSGTEPRFTFNTQLSVQVDSWKLLQNVASSMRATVLPGTIITLLQDRPASVVKLMTNANVITGFFAYTGTPLATRKTVAHVTFNDPADRHLPKTVSEENAAGIARYGFNPTDVAAFGATSEGQARRAAKWILDTELNTAEVCLFNVALDNADLLPGDIIKVMDRDYAGLELAGRVAGGSTTVIDLDRDVVLEGGESYTFSVMDADNQAISERTITTGAGTVSQVTVTPALLDTGVALKNQMWVIESDTGVVAREFRVLFMRELEKGKFEISASLHDSGKYARVETGITLPPDVYSVLDAGATLEIAVPTFEVQAYVDQTFGQQVKLVVKWTHDDTFTHKFSIQHRFDNGNFSEPIYRQDKEFEILNILPGTYEVMISAINTRGVSSVPVIADFTYAPGVNNTMDPPINLIVTPDTQDTSSITFATADLSFQFENNPDNDDIGGTGVFGGIAGYTIVVKEGVNEIDRREINNVPNAGTQFVQKFTFADNAATTGGPHRALIVEVYTRTADGALSTVAETKTFTNPFPAAPGLGLQDNPTGAFATVTPTGGTRDVAGSVICIRDTAGDFTPVEGDIAYQGSDLAMQIPFPAPLSARSIKAAVFDNFTFDFDDLVFSTVERQEPSPYGITSVTTLPTLPDILYPDGVVVYLTTDRKLYRVTLNGTVWDRSADGADITPASITTNEIAVGTIEAANIATGTITAASGVMAAASIETANIADLNVSTLKIENGAVTNIGQHEVGSVFSPTAFAGTTNGDFPITGTRPVTWVNIASVPITIDSTASDIIVQANVHVTIQSGYPTGGATRGSEWCGIRIRRDGFSIWQGHFDIGRNNSGWKKDFARSEGAVATIDGGISGSHTFYLDIFGMTEGSSVNTKYEYNQNTLIVTEVKR